MEWTFYWYSNLKDQTIFICYNINEYQNNCDNWKQIKNIKIKYGMTINYVTLIEPVTECK